MSVDFLITGGGGMLAYALKRELCSRNCSLAAPTRSELDVTDEPAVHHLVRHLRPRIIIQCAAYTRVDDAELHEEHAHRVNASAVKFVAEAAREVGARFVLPSTDYVFDGTAEHPYPPEAVVNPINAYGRSKAAGEHNAALAEDYLVVRTSWLYGPGGRNFVRTITSRIERQLPTRVVSDQIGCPTWTIDAARALVTLCGDPRVDPGIYHWCNAGGASWFDFAAEIAHLEGRPDFIHPCTTPEYPTPARRPAYSVLDCSRSELFIGSPREWQPALEEAMQTGAY